MLVEATAPGKTIFFGEHSVVYRGPAIVAAIDRRAKVVVEKRGDKKIYVDANDLGFSGYFEDDIYYPTRGQAWRGRNLAAINVTAKETMRQLGNEMGINVKVRSMIPIAVGLGSSAAVCVATVGAVAKLIGVELSTREISELAFEGERIIHGNPSGVDNNISSFGGVMKYERGKEIERFDFKDPLPFIIGNTNKRRSTRRMVEKVKLLRERTPMIVDSIIDTMGELSNNGLEALMSNPLDISKIGDLMNLNHGLLSAIGVSTTELDNLVHASIRGGAAGAKLTGAGGGGCMIAVAEEKLLNKIERTIRRNKGHTTRAQITNRGVEAKVLKS
jgi:mevalonate kinase